MKRNCRYPDTEPSEHKSEKEQALNSEQQYRKIFECSPQVIGIVDEQGNVLDVNRRLYDWLGYRPEEIIGKNFLELPFLSEESKTLVEEKLYQMVLGKDEPLYELTFVTKNGEKCVGQVLSNPIRDEKGRLEKLLVMARDITEQKKAEESLRLEKAHLDQLFESAQEGIVMADREGKILRVNSEFRKLFGYTRKEVLGEKVDELVVPEKELDSGVSLTNKVIEGENVNFEAIRQRKDGSLIHVSVLGSPIIVDGEVVAVYAIYRDITERKRSEDKIKASLQEREVMLREIHHRVKNNMQIISSLLRLQSRQIKNKKSLDIFNVGQNRIRSMALIHESLYQSKDLSWINFADYIKRLTTHLLSMYRIGIERVQLNVNVGEVYLDINRAIPCGLIINELVSNSLKHAFPNGQEGEIVVRMSGNNQGKISLIVKDNGVGFPEDLDFQRTETLGMQLVTDLVRQIEGKIELSREKGTEFKVVF